MHEVHTPALARSDRTRCWTTMQTQTFATPVAHPHLQSFQSIKTAHPLVIDLPALPPQHDVNPLVTKARSVHSDLTNAKAQRRLIPSSTLLVPPGTADPTEPTRPNTADPVLIHDPLRQLPTACRLQSFFAITSFKMCLSSVKSATSFFSRTFSSSSWRN